MAVSFLHIPLVEEKYNCNIYVLDKYNIPMLGSTISLLMGNCIMYKSQNRNKNQYFLLYDEVNQHYDCIIDIKKFMGVREFCYRCLKGFTHKSCHENHKCEEPIKTKRINTKNKFKVLKDLSHYITRNFTKGSTEEVKTKLELKNSAPYVEQILQPRYIVFDFECDTHTNIHKTNHVEVDILQIDEGQTHNYDDCLIEKFGINGYDCATKFCDWLFTNENRNSTVIAHNGAGYDNKFILQYCLNKGLVPSSFIRQGSRITYMNFNRFSIRFIDSLHFFSQPLKCLPKTYNIDTLKGYFPHHFNRPENQNYIGPIPHERDFGVNNMMPEDYDDFKKWYDEQKGLTDWNFKEEMIRYCRADVELLSKTVLKFRKMFKDNLDTDPFRYATLASLCMNIYINKFIPKKTIVGNSTEKKDSIVCREWLTYLNDENIRREVPVSVKATRTSKNPGISIRPITVDGLDMKNKIAYQFQGCYWHGCRKCHPENEMKYVRTLEQTEQLKEQGYKVVEMWECEWNKIKNNLPNKSNLEEQARHQHIDVRKAFFGGRTEGFKTYHKCNDKEKIFYYDIVSLYPTVNALDDYAVGFNRYVNNLQVNDIISGKFFGLVKVDISPPKDLYIPVLPDNSQKKLLFHLNYMEEKTFTSVELQLALKLGYEIKKIYSALEYKKYTGLMKDYVEFFLKIKIQNNKHYTPEECDRINQSHQNLGLDIKIQSEDTCKNPGMKALAKLCLNSLWGKFGQRTQLDNYDFMTEWNKLLIKMTDEKVKTKSWHIINESCVELRYTEDINYDVEPEYGSEITAAFTTANARIRLMSMLLWLDKSQLVYCDTDSVIFIYDKNNPKHKYPSNDAEDLPHNIRFGDALGEWENEFGNDEWIDEIVVGGAKSYSYKTNKGKIVVKQKGITLDKANSKIFTFEMVRDIVLNDIKVESEKRFQFGWNNKSKDIETKYVSRTVRQTVNTKREVLPNYDTLPIGHQDTLN